MTHPLEEGAVVYDEVFCEDCQERVDLSSATGLDEAKEIWKEHVRKHTGDQS